MEAKVLSQNLESRATARSIDSWKNLIGVFLAGCAIGAFAMNGHTTQNAIHDVSSQLGQTKAVLNTVQKHDIPALKAQAGCEEWRANQSEIVPDKCPHLKVDTKAIAKAAGQ